MKAAIYTKYGPPGIVVQIKDVDKPTPKDNDVLIRVRAASVNPLDGGLMKGKPYSFRTVSGLRTPKVTRIGVDVAGEVEAIGRNVTRFRPGDEVFGICTRDAQESGVGAWICQGAFAEYACAPETRLVLKPKNVTFGEAASAPVAAFTALQGLRDKGQIQPGEKVLINGASGGVGTFAVQIARSLGAEVTGVCSTANVKMVQSIGADHVMDYTQEDLTKSAQRYDLFFDCIANHSLSACRRLLNPKGRYIGVGGPSSRWIFALLARPFKMLVLSQLVSQEFVTFIAKPSGEDLQIIRELMATGKIRPVIDKSYSLECVSEAIQYLERRHARGKVIITVE